MEYAINHVVEERLNAYRGFWKRRRQLHYGTDAGGSEKEAGSSAGWEEPLKNMIISADTGYYSVKNLEACKELGVDAFVPDPQFRKRDVRFADAG